MSEVAITTKSLVVGSRPVAITDFGFSEAELAAATKAVITAREAAIMVTWSGVSASPARGHYCAKNASCNVLSASDVRRICVVREGSADAVVSITIEG